MFIQFIEIQNFRKLKSVRVDLSNKTTVFVGANNSGKTSAMVALSYFLIDKTPFTINDFTLSSWSKINEIGQRWESSGLKEEWETTELEEWSSVLPSIDVWLNASALETYQVIHLLPSLSWEGGLLGVRLRFQPKNIQDLFKEYVTARADAKKTIEEAQRLKQESNPGNGDDYLVSLWPKDMCEFLERRLRLFEIQAYKLDPAQIKIPEKGVAKPQKLGVDALAMQEEPFRKLIRIDKIDAHRGFSNLSSKSSNATEEVDTEQIERGKLSDQLRTYYKKHIDPSKMPDPSDVDALEAIHKAQLQFNEKLKIGFKPKFDELETLGYPGVVDPKLELSTKLKPVDGLNHPSAVKFLVSKEEHTEISITLPEHYNGLGYQNLISMVFKLMSFRDDWMQVGKAGKQANLLSSQDNIPPLHLVLVEEPEAHLHVQVQQVFIRKAYEILRKNDKLGDNVTLSTQLIVSTHSSHIAHECNFSQLRYFRRRQATASEVPISNVINLTEIFGEENDTAKFVSRYIKATHCDLFFADACILVEGSAERILVPHFIKENFSELHQSYISLLEIGGSHAFRFKNLLDHLGLVTLIITDLDSVSSEGNHPGKQPKRNESLITGNNTLKKWIPQKESIDELLDLPDGDKVIKTDEFYSVRVAYQIPIKIALNGGELKEVIPNSFEDAFVFDNISLIKSLDAEGLLKKCRETVETSANEAELNANIYELIKANGKLKAEFALDLLFLKDPNLLNIPIYIRQGLEWLNENLKIKAQADVGADISLTPRDTDSNG